MSEKVDLQLIDVQETLLLPLWGRAVEQNKKKPLLIDKEAIKIINSLNYDFTTITKNISQISQLGWVARALQIDKVINQFLEKHPAGTVVNIGCGFDTTYERVDNGTVLWYDLDLAEVIELRKKLIKESPRRKYIAKSFLDIEWLDQLIIQDNILFCSAGVFYYFEEEVIKEFINRLVNKFSNSEIVFDATSNIKMANKQVVKRGGMNENAFLKWQLKDGRGIEQWNQKIEIIGQIPMFKDLKLKTNLKNKLMTKLSDRLKMQYIIHLKVK